MARTLSVMLEGGEPEARPHFTLGYHDHVFTRDEEYAMMSRNDGTEARLYDLREDPGMYEDVAGDLPDIADVCSTTTSWKTPEDRSPEPVS